MQNGELVPFLSRILAFLGKGVWWVVSPLLLWLDSGFNRLGETLSGGNGTLFLGGTVAPMLVEGV